MGLFKEAINLKINWNRMDKSYQFSFEKLEVWQLSRALVKEVYLLTSKFPDTEKFGLVSQIRRSSISVSSNLAEGSSRQTAKDQAHFSTIAYSSLIETLNHLIISEDLGYLSSENLITLKKSVSVISVKINNLRIAQLARIK